MASLNWGSDQSFITKPRSWSRRSGRWWGPSRGTPWRRPAGGPGPGSRLSSLLTTVLLYELILSMFLCQPVFNLIKSYGFQLWCVISKKLNENSGFIAATLYILFRPLHYVKKLVFNTNTYDTDGSLQKWIGCLSATHRFEKHYNLLESCLIRSTLFWFIEVYHSYLNWNIFFLLLMKLGRVWSCDNYALWHV